MERRINTVGTPTPSSEKTRIAKYILGSLAAGAAFYNGVDILLHEEESLLMAILNQDSSIGHIFEQHKHGIIGAISSFISVSILGLGIGKTLKEKGNTQKELLEQAERYEALVNNMNDACIMCNEHGIIVQWNSAAERIFGFSAEEIIGNPIFQILPELIHKRTKNLYEKIRKGAETSFGEPREIFFLDKENNEIPCEMTQTITTTRKGVFITGIIRDIRERKQAETAKENFFAAMSHELRTPMNGVLGALQLLKDKNLTPKQQELVELALTSGEDQVRIINEILDYSKLSNGEIILENTPIDLGKIICDTVNLLSKGDQAKKIDLTYDIDKSTQYIQGDKTRISQILTNLINNALKFTESGEIAVQSRCIEENETWLKVQLSVKDSGIGIPAEKLETIFEQFTQADISTTRKYGGTGLGLSIVKKLVELMEGKIWVESEEGKGSTFYVELELEKDLNANIKAFPQKEKQSETKETLQGVRILIAEDNIMNQRILEATLKSFGCSSVIIVEDGQQAVEICKKKDFDIIIMDYQMPNMNGGEATKAIREFNQNTPIVAFSAAAEESKQQEFLDVGMNGVLAKPINLKTFLPMLLRFVPNTCRTEEDNNDKQLAYHI